MVQFSFPTSVFEHFELQVARTDSDNVSLCPKNGEISCSSPTIQSSTAHQLGDGFIHISSCEKNGQEMWRISLAGLPVPSNSVPFHESMMQSPVDHHIPNGQSAYPVDYSATPNPSMLDWTPWKMPDLLGNVSNGSTSLNVAPSQLSSPGGSLSNLQQLSDAFSQHSLDNSRYSMGGHPTLNSREYPFNIGTHQQDGILHSGISSPSAQSSLSDSGGSEDEDHNASSSSPTNTFPCLEPSCKKSFKRVHARNNHVKRRHSTIRNSTNAPATLSSRAVHQCTLSECGEQFTRRHDRMRHEWSQHGIRSDFACSHCPRLFSSHNRLDRHYAEKHPTIIR